MKFKHDFDKDDWDGRRLPPPSLTLFAKIADLFRISALDGRQITITSFWREATAKASYHPKGHAIDIRTKDLEPKDSVKLLGFMKAMAAAMNSGELLKQRVRIDVVGHEELVGTANQHIHIEVDDREPVKRVE